jgi:hypothetical protein
LIMRCTVKKEKGGEERGPAAGAEGGRGGAAIAAARSSPALLARALQGIIFKSKRSGAKRGGWRTHHGAKRGHGVTRAAYPP